HTRSKRDWSSDVCSSDLNVKKVSLPYPGRAFLFLLFLIRWLLPISAYEVNEEIIEELKEEGPGDVKGLSWNGTFIIVFVSGLIAVFFERLILKLNFGENYNIVFLYAIPIMFIASFIVSRHFKKKKIL